MYHERFIRPYSSAETSERYDISEIHDSHLKRFVTVSLCTTERHVALRNHIMTQLK